MGDPTGVARVRAGETPDASGDARVVAHVDATLDALAVHVANLAIAI